MERLGPENGMILTRRGGWADQIAARGEVFRVVAGFTGQSAK
jgi:hypothetical protein